MTITVDYSDIQGLVRFGFGKMTDACFFLLAVDNPAAARRWLQSAPVTSAVATTPVPRTALQVAFTWDGLKALGIPQSAAEGFSAEFLSGMSGDENRSRRLGDVGASDPARWQWGGPGKVPHALVMLCAESGLLEDWTQTVKGPHWAQAFHELACLPTSHLDGVEPFGFKDGISQPTLDWAQQRRGGRDETQFGNLLALGEFLLGYLNEYGKYTERPLVAETGDPQRILPSASEDAGRRDLGLNGTYLVFRDLQQDVRGFWRFMHGQAGGDPEARGRLAAAMVGRTLTGDPLMPLEDRRIAGVDPADEPLNRFTFDADRAGTRCPIGAHIRRANPRTADYPAGTMGLLSRLLRLLGFAGAGIDDDLIASARFHRILRRGREYGEGLSLPDALQPASGAEDRGLRFMCLNANIARQFEFVQNAWILGTKFAGLTGENDALLGNRGPIQGCPVSDTFSIPRSGGVARRITGLPQFVTTRGGAYFFLPSLRALRYLASLG
jgi:deferrochelatase/peroxidase EfeB